MTDLDGPDPVGHTRPVRSARLRTLALGLLLVVVAAGCASDAPLDTLDPKGPEAQSIDNLLLPVMLIAGVVFLFVELGIVYLVVRFRRRKSDDDAELPSQTHGNLVLELGWTILPAVILAFVAVGTLTTLFDIDDGPRTPSRSTSWANSGGGTSSTTSTVTGPTTSAPRTRWSSPPGSRSTSTSRRWT